MVEFSDTAVELMYSYLLLTSFLGIFFAVSGQSLFGSAFPVSPFTATTYTYVNTCPPDNMDCQATATFNQIIAMFNIPFQIIGYLWAIFVFFMTSPIYIWLGAIFIPAGVIIILLIAPIIARAIELLNQILQAIAEALPF
jgi:hypothetical protein